MRALGVTADVGQDAKGKPSKNCASHQSTRERMHYDLRLEHDGVFLS